MLRGRKKRAGLVVGLWVGLAVPHWGGQPHDVHD